MKSIALLIGINDYDNAKSLTNPHNDVDRMAEVLKRLQFDVIPKKDCTLAVMGAEIGKFQSACANYDVALFYFSGHGFQHKGENYLCVKDTQLGTVEVEANTSKKLEGPYKEHVCSPICVSSKYGRNGGLSERYAEVVGAYYEFIKYLKNTKGIDFTKH